MGVLRLLYCDSAGVGRCRAVVYTGDLPKPPCSKPDPAHNTAAVAAAEQEPELAAESSQLDTTPSLLEAAAAGIISLPPDAPPGCIDQQLQQQGLPLGYGALPAGEAAAAGPFATQQAALAAGGDGSFSSQGPGSIAWHSFVSQSSAGALLPHASGSRLLQPLSAAQLAAAQAAAPYSTGLTKGSMGQPAAADTVLPGSGLSAVGEVLLLPDLDAAVELPWAQGHSMAPVDMLERDMSKPFACCPRSALKHALSALDKAHSIQLLVGFELEFMLLKPAAAAAGAAAGSELLLQSGGSCYRPVDDSIYCQSRAFDQAAPVLDKMVEALQSMGVGVVQYHAESAPGQFEIATKPFPALQAADKLLLTKEAICGVAAQAGLAVSFLPKPLPGYAGSGCHCHISLWEAGSSDGSSSGKPVSLMIAAAPPPAADGTTAAAANRLPHSSGSSSSSSSQHYVPGYPLLSSTASCFLAGMLEHLLALLPFTCPTENSYARLQPGTWAGALTCWGWDNREAPLRLSCPNAADPAASCNIEFKAFDGTANPYIGLAAIVAAGMRGVEEAASLAPPLQVEPAAALAAATAAAAADGAGSGATAAAAVSKLKTLPGSLAEALAALQGDSSLQAKLQQLLGPELLRAYLAVKDWEAQQQTSTDKLLLRY
uniref:GS catalytic domain-containing protein n=1 Tax=Tetradesmus obliquus TaxID=3088 RepID=A0A383W2T1_TETOB|eukprot:jgi/Sobl393_1/11189/SZX71957.1